MWLLFALIVMPMVEIALFIQVGSWIGLWPTLALIVLTGAAGLAILRRQGLSALNDLRRAGETLTDPKVPIANGALVLLGGFLLMVPGFVSDALGLLLLVPPVRRRILAAMGRRVQARAFRAGPLGDPRQPAGRPPFEPPLREPHRPGVIIDGEFEELDPRSRPPQDPSGWTRH